MPERKPNTTYSAPIGSVDLAGEGWEIWPCTECLPWHVEVVRDPENNDIVYAREWHAMDCSQFQELLKIGDERPPQGD